MSAILNLCKLGIVPLRWFWWTLLFLTLFQNFIQVVSFLLQFVSGEAILFHIFTGLHVYCNFKLGLTCRITVIFGTLNDESLLINMLASNICFCYRNLFQNGVDVLSKIVDAFLLAGLDTNRGFLRFMFAVSPSKQFLKVGSPANAKFIVICKPGTWNDGGEDSVQYRNRKNHCFLAAAILFLIGKIIITW